MTREEVEASISKASEFIEKATKAESLEARLCFAQLAEAQAALGLLQMQQFLADKTLKKSKEGAKQ